MCNKLIYLISLVLVLGLAGEGWAKASNPSPSDGTIFPDTWASLGWQPGEHAVSFDIYFGEIYDYVKYVIEGTFQGNQSTEFFIVGFPGYPYPDGLVPETTYYWRIDEVNDLHPDSPWVGDVWSFTIPHIKAYYPEPADGAEFIEPDVTLSWKPGHRAIMHTVYFGDNFDAVNKASGGIPQAITAYNRGLLELGKTYYWRVDEYDSVYTHKGDVWSFTVRPGMPDEIVGSTIYVDTEATGNNDGSSWSNAFLCLQDALAQAQYGDEIRVANGTYRPDQQVMMRRDRPQIVSSGEWTATFQLIDGVAIKGAYAGFGEPDPDARDVKRYSSVLSGDLNANDGPEFTNIGDNSYQVVTAGGTGWKTVLDGFTITGGNADGPFPYNHGGGIYNVEGSPTLIDCTIAGNSTTGYGGGMHNIKDSNPALVNCTFSNNEADYGGGLFNDVSDPAFLNCVFTENSAYGGGGGGMCNYRSNPTLANCKFIENSAVAGGGMFNEECEPMLSDCVFNKNKSPAGSGGGMFNENGSPVLLSCIFSENSAPRRSGGAMHNRSDSQPSLSNCIFTGNWAINGGAMDNIHKSSPTLLNCTLYANFATQADGGGISNFQNAWPILVNSILWNNSDQTGMGATAQISGSAQVSYSCVQNSTSMNPWPGEGNINTDPLFADPENGDFHMKSKAGRWNPAGQSWAIDRISSPCIDAGDPSYPVGLERLPNGGIINMGAFGGTPEASLSQRQPLPLSDQASNPNPPDEAIDVDIDVILSWSPGFDGALYNVYFGTEFEHVSPSNFDSILVGQQTSINYDPGILNYNQTYYWRIDEVDNQGMVVTGEVWSFTTVSYSRYPKGRVCFTANTPVWINETLIPISQVTPGQVVCGADGHSQIEEVQEHAGMFTCYDISLQSGNCISVAENHYFLTESGQWTSLKELKAGIKLQTSKGSIEIINVTRRAMPYVGNVYNLNIAGSDRFFVGKDAVIVRDY